MAKYNYGTAAGGALAGAASGAATGAAFGSAIPVWGTAVGAVAGGLIGGAAALFGSKKKKKKQAKPLSTLDEQQQKLYSEKIKALQGQGQFGNLYNFDAMAANKNFDLNVSNPSYRNFKENIIPSITGQYRQGNKFNSSYSGEALSRVGRDIQESLNAQRSNMQYAGEQNAQTNKMNAIDNILNMQTFAHNRPGAPTGSSIDNILSSVAPVAAQSLFNRFGNNQNNTASFTGAPSNPAISAAPSMPAMAGSRGPM